MKYGERVRCPVEEGLRNEKWMDGTEFRGTKRSALLAIYLRAAFCSLPLSSSLSPSPDPSSFFHRARLIAKVQRENIDPRLPNLLVVLLATVRRLLGIKIVRN